MRKNRPPQNDASPQNMFSVYTYSLLDLAQQPTNLTAAPSHLVKGDLFL